MARDARSVGSWSARNHCVADLALRRGQTYATIVVDLKTHQPMDLVEGRDAKTLEDWLKARPGVEIISRDRAPDYAEGARAGAPQRFRLPTGSIFFRTRVTPSTR